MVAVLPLGALLFVPILIGMRVLYPWVRPETVADPRVRHAIAEKALYLQPGGFVARTIAYFVVWMWGSPSPSPPSTG
jgi:hypothetical protein